VSEHRRALSVARKLSLHFLELFCRFVEAHILCLEIQQLGMVMLREIGHVLKLGRLRIAILFDKLERDRSLSTESSQGEILKLRWSVRSTAANE
jgi:hypothetical protein